jgi:hypothetical protein
MLINILIRESKKIIFSKFSLQVLIIINNNLIPIIKKCNGNPCPFKIE